MPHDSDNNPFPFRTSGHDDTKSGIYGSSPAPRRTGAVRWPEAQWGENQNLPAESDRGRLKKSRGSAARSCRLSTDQFRSVGKQRSRRKHWLSATTVCTSGSRGTYTDSALGNEQSRKDQIERRNAARKPGCGANRPVQARSVHQGLKNVKADLYSRKVLSFRMSNTMTSDCRVEALQKAISRYGAPRYSTPV